MRVLFALLVLGLAFAMRREAAGQPATAAETNPVVRADNQFAMDLYARLDREQAGQNLFFSPTSVSLALAMTAAGARFHRGGDGQDAASRRRPGQSPRLLSHPAGPLERRRPEAALSTPRGQPALGADRIRHSRRVSRPDARAIWGRNDAPGFHQPNRARPPRDQPVGGETNQRQDQGPHPRRRARSPQPPRVDQRGVLQRRLGRTVR